MKSFIFKPILFLLITLAMAISCTGNSGRRNSVFQLADPLIGLATHIKIETAPGGVGTEVGANQLINGSPLTFYAVSRDTYGSFVADVSVNWSDSSLLGYFSQLTGSSTIYTPNGDEGITLVSASHTTLTSDFTNDITISYDVADISGLTLWLRADSLLGQLADDDNVISWNDKNGSARSIFALNSGSEPSFKTNIINGWPAIRFDASNSDGMRSSFPISDLISESSYTYFIIFSALSINTDYIAPWKNNALMIDGTGVFGATLRSGQPSVQSFNWDGASAEAGQNITLSTHSLLTSYHDAGYIFSQLNGSIPSIASSGNTSDLTGALNVGGGFTPSGFLNGDIAEIIIYNTSLSELERSTINKYLCNKYNLTCP